jgi:DNA topoisomerase-1
MTRTARTAVTEAGVVDASKEARQAARAEGLRYSSDSQPGFRRVPRGKGFFYRDANGRRITDPALLGRIRKLAIPPAYKDVWICAHSNGHLQATARDARGRKQYRYHPQWRAHRDATKFDRMLEFGRALPRIRRRVSKDLRARGLPREKVSATIVRPLEFRGKSGVAQRALVTDRAVARIVRDCRDIPGQELFQWIDEGGERRPIDSSDVNDYLREASGGPFTAKDYRTWFATLEALELLRRKRPASSNEARKQVLAAVKAVSEKLGNTPAICRKCYIHPVVLASHEEGGLSLLNGASAPLALRKLLVPAHKRRKSRMSPTYRSGDGVRKPVRALTAATSVFS